MIEHPHVQICGCARSGNTLMQCLMRCFDKIETPDDFRHPKEVFVPDFILKWGYPKQEGFTFVGKQPRALNFLKGTIPEHLFVLLMVRDGRDTIISEHTGKKHYVKPSRWIEANGKVLALREKYPHQTLVVKYEDLIVDYQAVLRQIAPLIKRPIISTWKEASRRYRGTAFAKTMRGVRPIDKTNTNKWNLETIKKLIAKHEKAFCDMLIRLGYEQDNTWVTK